MDEWDKFKLVKQAPPKDEWAGFKEVRVDKEPASRPFLDISDTGSALVDVVGGLGTTVPSAYRQLAEGMSNPWQRSPEYLASRDEMQKYSQRMEQADADAAASGDTSSVSAALRSAGPSLGFSAGAMGAGLTGSTTAGATGRAIGSLAGPEGAIAGELIGRTAGGFASGYGAAYRMAGAQFLDDARDELDKVFQEKLGRAMTPEEQEEAYQELLPLAQSFGHAEAGPEAIGNMAMAGAGKFIFGLGKETIKGLAKNALTKSGAAVAGLATELGGETATQVEQNRINQRKDAFMEGGDQNAPLPSRTMDEYAQAFKEVAPATLATMGLMSGVAAGAKGVSMLAGKDKEQEGQPPIAAPTREQPEKVEATGVTIKAGAPATITPEFLEDLPEGDLIELEKAGHISRPPPITPLPGASAAEQAVFDDAALNVLEAGSTVSATAEAAREADVLEKSPAVETPAESTAATSEDQSEVAGSGVPSKPAEGSIPAVEGIIPQEEVVSSTEVEQTTPEETVAETATVAEEPADVVEETPQEVLAAETTKGTETAPSVEEEPAPQQWSVYPGTHRGEKVWMVQTAPDKRGFGDWIFDSEDAASIEASREKQRDAERRKSIKEAQDKADAEAKAVADRNAHYDAFLADSTPMQRGKKLAALNKRILSRGEEYSIGELIRKRVSEGFKTKTDKDGRWLTDGDTYVSQSNLTKIGLDYADFLNSQKSEVAEKPIVEEAPKPTPIQDIEAAPVTGEPVVVNVNGNDVIGTVSQVNDDGTADVDYSWNGEDYAKVQSLLKKIRRPARSMAAPPNYEYTQEQNTRKAQRVGLPVDAGVHVDAGQTIKTALQNIAKDTSLSQMLRAAARALGNTSFEGVDLRVDTDGRRRYAGYYLNDEGITEIGLNLRHVGRGKVDAVGTFVHEALHHATLAKVRDPQTDIEKESVEALGKIAQRVRAYAASKELLRRYDYETSNVEEFISALFTRPDFQNFLASIPADFSPKTAAGKFRSVLSEIFRIIAQLVTGQRVAKGSTMEQAMTGALVLFETPQRQIETGPLDLPTGSAELDAEYMAAVNSGDMVKAQKMVNDFAKAAGYNVGPVYHGTKGKKSSGFPFTEFEMRVGKNTRGEDNPVPAAYFTENRGVAEGAAFMQSNMGRSGKPVVGTFFLRDVKRRDDVTGDVEYRVTDPSQIKSAAPITHDAQGNIIPLSQRFNPSSSDIRYSPATGYQTPTEQLEATAAKMRGEATTDIPKGMESLLRPQVRGATSGARGLGKLFQTNTPAVSLESTYEQVVRGKSTPMVSLDEMFTVAQQQNPSLTEAEFGRQVKQAYDAGLVFLEPAETTEAQSKVARFGVKDSGGFTATGMMMVPPSTPLSAVDDTPPATPISPLEAKKALIARFGKEVADKIRIGNFGQLGGRDWDGMLVNGEIAINLNFFSDAKAVIDKVEHEMAHAVWNEPTVQAAWNDLRQSMTPEQKAKIEQEVRDLEYDPAKVDEETLVRFLEQVRATTPASKWKAFMDAVVDAFRRLFGFEPDARTARLAAARIIASAEQAVARGLDPDTQAFSMRETRSRFAPPEAADRQYEVLSQEENDKLASAWIDSLGTMTAAEMLMAGKTPASMQPSVKENIAGTLLQQLTVLSTGPTQTPDQQLVATVMLNRLGRYWTQAISQDPARALQQRAVQNSRLYPIAPILKAEQVLEDRAEKIMQARFTGGTPAAVAGVAQAAENSALDADERVERILQTLIGNLGPKETAKSALAQMFRGKGQRDQIIDEVSQALMVKARGNTVSPERKSALAQLVSSLKSTLSSQVKGEAKAAPESTLPELLTRAFVNQVAEGDMFKKSWEAGREKVLDMLINMEMDKAYHPAEKNLKDAQSRLTHLEAGSEQQVADSAVERAALKQQIADIKAEMKSELAAINAMMPELKAQRDALMPVAVTMAFDPAASKEAITRAFEQAGYTAEIATGLDKSGKRTLSMKDALRDKTRAINAVMNVFDEGMKPLDAATQNEWQKAIPVARKAVEETLNEWQKQVDKAEAARLENQKTRLLDENSKPLQQLINKLRGKMFPGMRWGDIFVDLPETQEQRQQALTDRVMKHEALQGLTQEEKTSLAEEINKVWQGEREKAFKKELKRAGLLKEKSVVDRANVFAAVPRLIQLLNLGVMNASTFREAVAPHFGLRTLTREQATRLRQMASEAWKEPEGVLRNRKLRALLDEMQSVTQASWSEIMNGYWTASILSGLRTQFDTYMAVINGFGTNLMQAGAAMVRAKSVTAGVEAHLQWWQGLLHGIKESGSILAKGDTSFLKRFSADLNRALEGEKGASPVPIGERLWKEGNIWSKFPAAVMIFTGRMMTAADHINNTATTQGAMAVARALHPELYGGRVSFTPEENADARKQAIREALGGKEPETFDERRLVNVRTREILNTSITEEDRVAASAVGDMAAYQNDPTGFFGAIHSSIKSGLNTFQRKADEVADDETVNRFTRALMATLGGAMHAITGTRFMRFGFNFGNDIIRYIPGSYLLGPLGFFGRETSQMERDLLMGKNIVGLVLASILGSLFWDDDETKEDDWHIEGDWTSLSPEEQSKRRSLGISPQSLWKRSSKDGSIETVLYKQWPTMGLFAGIGGMQDERRYKPKEWAERGTAGHLLNMAWNGTLQIQNVSAVRGLGDLFGTSSATSGRSAEALKDKIVGLGVNYATGLIPTALKDIDKLADPRNYKPEGVLEKLEAAVPLARRYVNDGRPQLNLFGDEVKLNREPWSRLASTSAPLDPAYAHFAVLRARGHDLQQANTGRQVFKDGKKVPLDTISKDLTWRYEKAVGQAYKAWMGKDGQKLIEMDVEQADKVIDKMSRDIRDRELKKIQVDVNK